MSFAYTEEEFDFYIGAAEGILYYQRLHELGFHLDQKMNYYIDFSGYNASMNCYEDFVYADIIYSLSSPLIGQNGDTIYSDYLGPEGQEFFSQKNIYHEGYFSEEQIEQNDCVTNGIYIHLEHPYILEYIKNHQTDMTDLTAILDGFKNELEMEIEDGLYVPNTYSIDEEGIYLFLSIYGAYYVESFSFFISTLAEEISLNKDKVQEASAS